MVLCHDSRLVGTRISIVSCRTKKRVLHNFRYESPSNIVSRHNAIDSDTLDDVGTAVGIAKIRQVQRKMAWDKLITASGLRIVTVRGLVTILKVLHFQSCVFSLPIAGIRTYGSRPWCFKNRGLTQHECARYTELGRCTHSSLIYLHVWLDSRMHTNQLSTTFVVATWS